MCIRERLRAVSTVRQCTVGLARSACPCPLGGPPIADRDIGLPARTSDDRSIEGAGAGSTRLPNPRRFDEQNPVVARAVRGYFCVFN